MKDQTRIDAREADKTLDGNSRIVRDSETTELESLGPCSSRSKQFVADCILYCEPMSVI
jgi:hypothetical protein